MLDKHLYKVHDVLLLITGMAEKDFIFAFELVELGMGQAILMHEPSRQ